MLAGGDLPTLIREAPETREWNTRLTELAPAERAAVDARYPNRDHLVVMPLIPWNPYQNDHEDANGQFEMNWEYDSCLKTADRHAFFKFMVKSIAEESGIAMPHFFGYMGYSAVVLLPIFALTTVLFFL